MKRSTPVHAHVLRTKEGHPFDQRTHWTVEILATDTSPGKIQMLEAHSGETLIHTFDLPCTEEGRIAAMNLAARLVDDYRRFVAPVMEPTA